jgi:hypothetical protein
MKKLFALFLMCWLPLFMSSAWAMDLQMQTTMPQQQETMSAMSDMPCHMEASETQATSDVACANCLNSSTDAHNCASCGLCMISLTATQIETLVTSFNVTPSNAISLPDLAFFSLDYPPALKPPIHS